MSGQRASARGGGFEPPGAERTGSLRTGFVISNPAPYQARRSPQAAPIKGRAINAFGDATASSFRTAGKKRVPPFSGARWAPTRAAPNQIITTLVMPAFGNPQAPNPTKRPPH